MTIPFTDPAQPVPPAPSSAALVPAAPDATSTLKSVGAGSPALQWVQAANDLWIPKSLVTTVGDLIVATGNGAVGRLAAGAASTVLTGNGAGVAPSWQAAATGALTQIASAPISGGSITFSSIPQTFQHLLIICRLRSAGAGPDTAVLRFNGDSIDNYFYNYLQGQASTASAVTSSANTYIGIPGIVGATNNAHEFSSVIIEIPNYTEAANWKEALFRASFDDSNSANGMIVVGGGMSQIAAALTSLSLAGATGNLSSAGNVVLYGLS